MNQLSQPRCWNWWLSWLRVGPRDYCLMYPPPMGTSSSGRSAKWLTAMVSLYPWYLLSQNFQFLCPYHQRLVEHMHVVLLRDWRRGILLVCDFILNLQNVNKCFSMILSFEECFFFFSGSRLLTIGEVPKDQVYPMKYPLYKTTRCCQFYFWKEINLNKRLC